jgi:FtsH-binding integral membrane protein
VSPARRLIILAGFTLMVAGIVLLLSQEEEVFVALSVLGFVVVVAAVPPTPASLGSRESRRPTT